ncbi:hypothetical protein SGPA1_40724 [Streptomyces misionensis JCM 4497]
MAFVRQCVPRGRGTCAGGAWLNAKPSRALVQHSTDGDGLVLALLTVRLLGPSAGAIAVIALLTVLVGSRRTADGRLPGLIGRAPSPGPGSGASTARS